jgi:hypothetical protein
MSDTLNPDVKAYNGQNSTPLGYALSIDESLGRLVGTVGDGDPNTPLHNKNSSLVGVLASIDQTLGDLTIGNSAFALTTPQKFNIAAGDGVTNSTSAVSSALAQASITGAYLPKGNYVLTGNVGIPVADNGFFQMGVGASWSGGFIRTGGIGIAGANNIFATWALKRTFGAGQEPPLQTSSNDSLVMYLVGRNVSPNGGRVVTLRLDAEAAGTATGAFALNPVARATTPGSAAICIEADPQVMASGGQAYGIIVSASGNFPTGAAAFQVQGNNPGITMLHAYNVDNGDQSIITGAVLRSRGAACTYGVNLKGVFSAAEWESPQLRVPSTPGAGVVSSNTAQCEIIADTAGNVTITAKGINDPGTGVTPATNASLRLRGTGTGDASLQAPNGTRRVSADATGLGFYGTAPIAKPTITGSRGGNAALASLLTQLAALGLVTDETTA